MHGDSKRKLLFFTSDVYSPERAMAVPTLAWLADKKDIGFDSYICSDTPHSGNWHQEQFYFVSNFFDMYYCSITSLVPRFSRFALSCSKVLSVKKVGQIVDFYQEVFDKLDESFPSSAVIAPEPSKGDDFVAEPSKESEFKIDSYCYPEIYYKRALGLSSNVSKDQLLKMQRMGVKDICVAYCSNGVAEMLKDLGFNTKIVDGVKAGDTYGSITSRIVERWIKHAKGIAFASPPVATKWLSFFIKDKWLPVFEPKDWVNFCKTVACYSNKVGNKIVWGSQNGIIARPRDTLITELSKYDLTMSLCPDYSPCMSTKRDIPLPIGWLSNAKAPWEEGYSENFLIKKVKENAIAVSLLFYAADLGHRNGLYRILDLYSNVNFKAGIAFPSTWYEYGNEVLEDLYVPPELGGVFPRLEPLLSSAGVGVATEAKGFLKQETLKCLLAEAKRVIGNLFGERLIPIGYYPWEDACPYYKHDEAEPQFQALVEAGIKYCITYKDEAKEPRIVFEDGDGFIAINQQSLHWTDFMFYSATKEMKESMSLPLDEIKKWEEILAKKGAPGWIIIGLDSPFWANVGSTLSDQSPGYANPNTPRTLHNIFRAMDYIVKGGSSGKLFTAKPHEVIKYAQILQRQGLL